MRIAFYTQGTAFNGNTINEKGLGGSESALLYIAKSLAALGNQVYVFNNCDKPGTYAGVKYLPFTQIVSSSATHPLDICVFCRFYEPVVQVEAKIKVLWLHDIAKTPYYKDTFPALNEFIDDYFFISEWQKNGFINLHEIPEDKVFLTRNGVDLSLFQADIPRNNNKLIYINTPFRGLDVLLRIFPTLRQSRPELELHLYTGMSLYGDNFSAWEEDLKRLYQHAENMPGVHLCSPVPKSKLALELKSAFLSLYPSHFRECCSIASLETQAAGTPMITSSLGGLPETVIDGKTGVLIPVDQQKNLSYSEDYQRMFISKTLELLNNGEQWEKLSLGAKKHISGKYTWDLVGQEWSDRFTALIQAAR